MLFIFISLNLSNLMKMLNITFIVGFALVHIHMYDQYLEAVWNVTKRTKSMFLFVIQAVLDVLVNVFSKMNTLF